MQVEEPVAAETEELNRKRTAEESAAEVPAATETAVAEEVPAAENTEEPELEKKLKTDE